MKKRLNKKGFTLIELIVVIAILAILAAILIPSLVNYISKATEARDSANCRSLYTKFMLDYAVDPATATEGTDANATSITATITNGVVSDFTCVYPSGTYSDPNFAPAP